MYVKLLAHGDVILWTKRKIAHYKKRDNLRGLKTVDFTAEWLYEQFKNGKCIYCGESRTKLLTLDKKYNIDGHHKLNTVISCIRCNTTRGDNYSARDFLKYIAPGIIEYDRTHMFRGLLKDTFDINK